MKQQKPDGSWACPFNAAYPMGPTALGVLTALKGGVKADDPAVRGAFDYLRKLPFKKTYSVSVLSHGAGRQLCPRSRSLRCREGGSLRTLQA